MRTGAGHRWTLLLACAVLVAGGSAIVAARGVPAWEADVFHAVNDLPDLLERPMWIVQLAGLLLVPALLAIVAALTHHPRLAIALLAVIPCKLAVEHLVIKQVVERERPAQSVCEGDLTCLHLRDAPTEGLSFVSGHAVIAWSVATLLWTVLPAGWRWLPIAVATLNALARVYLGAHNPLDVVGGGAAGVAIGAAIALVSGLATGSRRAETDPHDEGVAP